MLSDHWLKLTVGSVTALGTCTIAFGAPPEKVNALVTCVTTIGGLLIVTIAHVQSTKINAANPAPAQQLNVASSVQNDAPAKAPDASPAPVADAPPPPVAEPPAVVAPLMPVAAAPVPVDAPPAPLTVDAPELSIAPPSDRPRVLVVTPGTHKRRHK